MNRHGMIYFVLCISICDHILFFYYYFSQYCYYTWRLIYPPPQHLILSLHVAAEDDDSVQACNDGGCQFSAPSAPPKYYFVLFCVFEAIITLPHGIRLTRGVLDCCYFITASFVIILNSLSFLILFDSSPLTGFFLFQIHHVSSLLSLNCTDCSPCPFFPKFIHVSVNNIIKPSSSTNCFDYSYLPLTLLSL